MKRTPLKRTSKLLKRAPVPKPKKKRSEGPSCPSKRKRKTRTPLKKLKDAIWQECRRITFERHGSNCYTCGAVSLEGANRQCGHFIPSSVCSVELRYDLDNLRPQCMSCNINKSGNWPAYEAHLIIDHGRDYPDQLKQKNQDTKGKQYDILWYLEKLDKLKNL